MNRISSLGVGAALLCAALSTPLPSLAADVLQCVPYARSLSGVAIHGDAWTWWSQARGRYRRGHEPRAGAVLALANTDVMPLGHVAVVSRIVDERRILLSHANWSGPGVIERDVLAVDSSDDNDWSSVRIWWGQSGHLGARDNPVNGFIYPDAIRPFPPASRIAASDEDTHHRPDAGPRLAFDMRAIRAASDTRVTRGERSLADIIADVKRQARLR